VRRIAEESLAIARAVAIEATESDLEFVAAGLAYYSLMAVTPALVLGFLLLVEIGGQSLARAVVSSTDTVLSPAGQRFIHDTIRQVSARSGVGVVAAVLAVTGAYRLYTGLEEGVWKIYGVDDDGIDGAREALRVLGFGALGTFGILGVGVAASLSAAGGAARLASIPLTFLVASVVSYPILNGMTPSLDRHESLPGALFTAVTWTAGAVGVGLLAGGPSRALYGVLGGLLLLLTWFFAANLMLLLGFTIDAVCSRRALFEAANSE